MAARGSKLENKPGLSDTEGPPGQAEGLGVVVLVVGSHSRWLGRGRSRAKAEPQKEKWQKSWHGGPSPGLVAQPVCQVPGSSPRLGSVTQQ